MIDIQQGEYNQIHESVKFLPLCDDPGPVLIGDCNTIHENVKIIVGKEGFRMGDWNTIHNGVFIMDDVRMGHNCWVGQGSHLDGRGTLRIGNGVSISYFAHIWTHVARGALLDGCTLFGKGMTILEDDVWMVGNNVHISPNVTVAEKSIILSHSVVTSNTEPKGTYRGVPARQVGDLCYWQDVSDKKKLNWMEKWARDFCDNNPELKLHVVREPERLFVYDTVSFECLYFSFDFRYLASPPDNTTHFNLSNMTYTKKLTELERKFYAFIKDYKARFIPV